MLARCLASLHPSRYYNSFYVPPCVLCSFFFFMSPIATVHANTALSVANILPSMHLTLIDDILAWLLTFTYGLFQISERSVKRAKSSLREVSWPILPVSFGYSGAHKHRLYRSLTTRPSPSTLSPSLLFGTVTGPFVSSTARREHRTSLQQCLR